MRAAPQWIRDAEKRHQRRRWMWNGAVALGWLGFFGWWACALLPPRPTALWNTFAVLCLVGWLALDHLDLGKRAARHENAADALNAAITRYEVIPDLPESTLRETERRAREVARVERIRIAPAWIRSQRRRYRLSILFWVSPVALVLALQIPAAHLGWASVRPWIVVCAGMILLIGGMFRTVDLTRALRVLSEAIDRYEYESAATEGDLEEARRNADACGGQ